MLKKYFLAALIAVSLVGTGLTSCKNDADDDDDETTTQATVAEAVAGSYEVDNDGSVGVTNCATTSETLKIEAVSGAKDKVNITLPNVVWTDAMTIPSFTVHNVVVSTTDNENYTFTLDEFSETVTDSEGDENTVKGTSVTGTFVKSTKTISVTATYKYGIMPMKIVQTCATSSSSSRASAVARSVTPKSLLSSTNGSASECYGTYTGTWTIGFIPFSTTVYVDATDFYFFSSKMKGSYEYVSWVQNSDGTWTCYGSHKSGEANAAKCAASLTTDGSTGSFYVRAMNLIASPATLTKQ